MGYKERDSLKKDEPTKEQEQEAKKTNLTAVYY